jgi:uncharacterized integral membrane protein
MRVFFFLALLIALIVTIFAVQNIDAVDITFITWRLSGSLALVLIITLILGILIGVMIMMPSAFRRRLQISGLRKQIQRLGSQVESLELLQPPTEEPPTEAEATQASSERDPTDEERGNELT